MAKQRRILIAGGYGVFGLLLARELRRSNHFQVVIAGRNLRRATKACRALGPAVEPLALDLNDLKTVHRAATDCFAVVCTAGPFQALDPRLPKVVALAGSHWLDISDFEGWVTPTLHNKDLHETGVGAGVAIMPGLSTTPSLSGILVRWGWYRVSDPHRARLTLFIGNRNSRGTAAISSAVASGFQDPMPTDLPSGPNLAYRFPSVDETLLREELGLQVEFRVAFEWRLTPRVLALAHRVALRVDAPGRVRLARLLRAVSWPLSFLGSDIGCLKAEVLSASETGRTCTLVGRGQRLAVLPCLLAIEALADGEVRERGCVRPAVWLPPEEFVQRLEARGIEFSSEEACRHGAGDNVGEMVRGADGGEVASRIEPNP